MQVKSVIRVQLVLLVRLRSQPVLHMSSVLFFIVLTVVVCLFVLRFYGPVNPMESCRARSVYLTTHLLRRLSPLIVLCIISPETDNCPS